MGLARTLRFIARHPLNRGRPLAAVGRFLRWQFASRVFPAPVVVPFVDQSRLLVMPGMTGATGNLYCGLQEFEDMAVVLHGLRKGELMVDVGANVGVYTVLAAAAAGATVIAIEPIPQAYRSLCDNLRLNDIAGRVTALNLGAGSRAGRLRFTRWQDTLNHVLADEEPSGDSIDVDVQPLDRLLGGSSPTLLKIDVEGFETEVVAGAAATLADPALRAVLIETNGSGARYGHADGEIDEAFSRSGFQACNYEPLTRELRLQNGGRRQNTLYVRNPADFQARLRDAKRFRVNDLLL